MSAQQHELPLPPRELAFRAGRLTSDDTDADYLMIGREMRADIDEVLGPDWSWHDKRVLDFGCGAGRLLRHFAAEAEAGGRFSGCDVDTDAIGWLRDNLVPPLERAFASDDDPPLDLPDDELDLVIATSVFTHFDRNWASWLLELRRVLRPGGLLLASFLGSGMSQEIADENWEEDRIGMNPITIWGNWNTTKVLHSEWWLRAHWGRAFEILVLRPSGFGREDESIGHGLVLAQAAEAEVSVEDLERPEPGEPRELVAARHNLRQQQRHTLEVAMAIPAYREKIDVLENALRAEQEGSGADEVAAAYGRSRSWRLTRPLRALKALGRSRGRDR